MTNKPGECADPEQDLGMPTPLRKTRVWGGRHVGKVTQRGRVATGSRRLSGQPSYSQWTRLSP